MIIHKIETPMSEVCKEMDGIAKVSKQEETELEKKQNFQDRNMGLLRWKVGGQGMVGPDRCLDEL